MTTQPMIEQLIAAQLDFLDCELAQPDTLQQEFTAFYHWLSSQQLQQLCSVEQIYNLLEKQVLATPASAFLIEQIATHIGFALQHPLNQNTRIEAVIPVATIDHIAQYVASKTEHRQRLIKTVVHNPAFAALITQLIQNSIQDYLDQSVLSNRVPGVGHFMKMGKSMLESVTDSNLNETIANYLQKNISKTIQMSERVLNQYFDDDKLYHYQANLWHKIKLMPISVLTQYIEVQDLPKTVPLAHDIWDHLRQTPYLKQQLHDGIASWYAHNQERSLDVLLRDLNIDESLIEHELSQCFRSIFQQVVHRGYFRQRARTYLEKFYASPQVVNILNSER
ncbi:MAG: hypothetical protein E6Q26_04950 [Acinetobacter sp.]|nr:hypothetical protein [Acinetobacter sp.]MBP7218264.1 hypothetical protein [Acinetobacter sp.]TXJ02728.1 MAG: hypothetical protein E6Q26_04950 [Acinetobacter sp.]